MLLKGGRHFRKASVSLTYIPMLLFLFLCWGMTGDHTTFLAAAVFFLLFFHATTLSNQFYFSFREDGAKKAYLYSALVMAMGIHIQFFLYQRGVEVGRVITYGGGRTAFSLVWMDFSFISLFFMSALPFIFLHGIVLRIVFAILLFGGALISTGRTGIASALLALVLYIIVEFIKGVSLGRLKMNTLAALIGVIILPLAIIWANSFFGVRQLTVSDSGRFDGYLAALHDYLNGNILFGRFFDINSYSQIIETIPHNLFLYMLLFGGMFFLLAFLLWFLFVWREFMKASKDFFYSMLIVMIGTMLIPSFFSMYFFSSLIALVLIVNIKADLEIRRDNE